MAYEAKDFSDLIGMPGFSEKLLTTHFKLYEGYVKNTNKCLDIFKEARQEGNFTDPKMAEVRRRFGWEFNGMRLHEVYFGNLIVEGSELEDGSPLSEQINKDFGSFDNWKKEFSGIGGMRGIGWASLQYDPQVGRLFNTWIGEHNAGHIATGIPIMLLDVFEHAFIIDYGTDKNAYMDAFFQNACWQTANERFKVVQEQKEIPLVIK